VIALWFSGTFAGILIVMGVVAGLTLFAFAWIGRSIATGEAFALSTHGFA
jgi:hypothetical protein